MKLKSFAMAILLALGGVNLSGVTIKFVDAIRNMKNMPGVKGQLALVQYNGSIVRYIYNGTHWLAVRDAESAGAPQIADLPTYRNCKEIKNAVPDAKDGLYLIDPDGAGENMPFKAYCDMSYDGGGWTLAFVMDASGDVRNMTFPYDAGWEPFTPKSRGTKTIGYPQDHTKLKFSEWRLTSIKHPNVNWLFGANSFDSRIGRSLLNGPNATNGMSANTRYSVTTTSGKHLCFEHNNGGGNETHDIPTLGNNWSHVWVSGMYWGNIDSIGNYGGILNTSSAHSGSSGGNTGDRLLIYLR